MSPPARGETVGPYVLEAPLGEGAHGEVWRARHPGEGLLVALKRGRRAAASTLDHELAVLRRLRHPAILPILDHGSDGGRSWIVLPLAAGSLAERPPDPQARRDLVDRLLAGLAHAHARGVLHQDLKPSNVLRTGSGWALADFGVAALLGGPGEGTGWGTPGFMAPEQRRGEAAALGPWSDLYALGRLVLGLLGGGSGPSTALLPSLDPRMRRWLAWLLAPHPADRPRSAAQARACLPGEGWARPVGGTPTAAAATATAAAAAGTAAPGPVTAGSAPTARPTPTTPALPASWPEPDAGSPLHLYRQRGRALLDLRPAGTVGRRDELRRLWSHLLAGRRGAVAVVGAPGVGARHLVTAVGTAAAEHGAAVLSVDDDPAAALSAWLGPAASLSDRAARLRATQARLEAWALDLGLAGRLLAGIDDASEAAPALALLVAHLPGPRLLLLPAAAALSSADRATLLAVPAPVLLAWPAGDRPAPGGAEVVALGPLPPADLERLATDLLDLAPSLVAALVDGADGRPGALVASVRRLWEEGGLVHAPEGWRDADGEVAPGVEVADLELADVEARAEEARAAGAAGRPAHGLLRARRLLSELGAAGVPASDPRQGRAWRAALALAYAAGEWSWCERRAWRLVADPAAHDEGRAAAAMVLAGLLSERDDDAGALAVLDGCPALASLPVPAGVFRGFVLSRLERHDEALATFDRLLAHDLDPARLASVHRQAAQALVDLGRLAEARRRLDRAFPAAAGDQGILAGCHSTLGCIEAASGDRAAARDAFQRAADLLPAHDPNGLFNQLAAATQQSCSAIPPSPARSRWACCRGWSARAWAS